MCHPLLLQDGLELRRLSCQITFCLSHDPRNTIRCLEQQVKV